MEPISIREIVTAVNGKLISGDAEQIVTHISTNSKEIEEGTLFVPIIGERFDAHDFIESALKEGAVATFTSKNLDNMDKDQKKAYILVDDTLKALQLLGAYYRNQFHIPVIGITGSVGKTTTKEMIAAALETKYKVLKTAGNMNSQIGLPLTMFRINKEHEVAVIEMGMSEVGEMERLSRIARPNIAVMTNIGVSHIGQLKTQENIRKEKLNIINEFNKEGILYLNDNDRLLDEIYNETQKKERNDKEKTQFFGKISVDEPTKVKLEEASVITFGTTEHSAYKAENIQTVDGETHFTLQYEGGAEKIVLRVLGVHNVYNALVALAIADQLKIEPKVAKQGLKEYMPIAMRGQIHEKNGMKIIDDTYNASPDSMKGGINVLLELGAVERRIAVLADVLELGELSHQCHYEVGEYISDKKIDYVVTIGNEAKAIKEAIDNRESKVKAVSFENNIEAIEFLKDNLRSKDAILIKGSRGMKTDEIVKALLSE